MEMSCGCSSCSQCCHANSLFWVYMLGIAGTFVSLFFFFWQYAGTLTQFTGPDGDDYKFVANGGDLSIYKDNLLIASNINLVNNGITTENINDLRRARCRGTALLWTILVSGFLGALLLLSLMVTNPSKFICCSLQHPAAPLHPVPPVPMPLMRAQTSTTTVPAAPTPTAATTAATGARPA